MAWIAGVDGCPGGWLAIFIDMMGVAAPRLRVERHFAGIIAAPEQPVIIAVDMPIGLPERVGPGGRGCDVAARAVLGGRQSSLFAVPARAAVMAQDYSLACERAFALSEPPRKVSKQCFNLFPKIREIDALMTPPLQNKVRECHPEVAFWALNGDAPLDCPKKVKSRPFPEGLAQRRALLERAGLPMDGLLAQSPRTRLAGADDVLDAAACAWVAACIARGSGRCFPDQPLLDGRGLSMAIWTGPAA
jgi:predicted RNase H-like nuclease